MELAMIISEFPSELQMPMLHLVHMLREERGASKEDFSELKAAVQGLVAAQKHTDDGIRQLVATQKEFAREQQQTAATVKELVASQKETAATVKELVATQKEFAREQQQTAATVKELVASQKEIATTVKELVATQKEFAREQQQTAATLKELVTSREEINHAIKELTEAQTRTENRVEEVAALLNETICAMRDGFKSVDDRISTLGGRWGFQNEATMRNTMRGVLGETDYSVERGYYAGREVDVVIRGDGVHIMLEITSGLRSTDIPKYVASADAYEQETGVAPRIMVAAPHIPPQAIKAINEASRPIELFSADEGL